MAWKSTGIFGWPSEFEGIYSDFLETSIICQPSTAQNRHPGILTIVRHAGCSITFAPGGQDPLLDLPYSLIPDQFLNGAAAPMKWGRISGLTDMVDLNAHSLPLHVDSRIMKYTPMDMLLNYIFVQGGDRTLFSKDQQQPFEASRNLFFHSHLQKKFQWKALLDDQRIPFSLCTHDHEPVLKEEEGLNVFDRAEIAKQRLKMILISDRCSVNDSAKRKIVNNIVGALADFVEIKSQDRVRLNVSADPDLGTVYSVSVPVRRVKLEFQDNGDDELKGVVALELEEKSEFPELQDVQGLAMGLAKTQDAEVWSSSLELQDVEG